MPDSELTASRDGDIAVVGVHGDIDLLNTDSLPGRIIHAVPDTCTGVVVDITGVHYLDSAGVRSIFTLARRLQLREQRLAIAVSEQSPVRRLLKVTRTDEVASICDDVTEAVAVLKALD